MTVRAIGPDGKVRGEGGASILGVGARPTSVWPLAWGPHPRALQVKRRKKVAGAPKRPLSAYNIFFSEERVRLKEEAGDKPLLFGDMGKIIAKRWAELSEDDKEALKTRAAVDRQRYFKDMEVRPTLQLVLRCASLLRTIPNLLTQTEPPPPGLVSNSQPDPHLNLV